MNQNFTQMISVSCDYPEQIVELLAEWDRRQAEGEIMGYMGTRVLADRERLGHYIIIADFGVVDPNVSAADEAARNNVRPETLEWGASMREIIEGEPLFRDFDEVYRTDP